MGKRLSSNVFYVCLFVFFLGFFQVLSAQENVQNVVIGKQMVLDSKILGEKRPIMFSLPRFYHTETRGYPVLYVLDGGAHFLHATTTARFLSDNGRSPKVIVIAVRNTDRNRDFTPTEMKDRASSGGGETFLRFMKEELFPFVEKNFRTVPYRILFGHSLTGGFSVYTLFSRPAMFNAHIAVSPYVMLDNGFMLDMIEGRKQKDDLAGRTLFFTVGNEPAYTDGLKRLRGLLDSRTPRDFKWKFEEWLNDDHGSVPLKSLYNGLEFIFSQWRIPRNIAEGGVKAIEAHLKKISDRYAYPVTLSEGTVNRLGYQMLQKKKYARAIEIFKYNVKNHPESSNVYDSLGDGYRTMGELEMARRNYETAVKIAKKTNHVNLRVYETNLGNLLKEIRKKK